MKVKSTILEMKQKCTYLYPQFPNKLKLKKGFIHQSTRLFTYNVNTGYFYIKDALVIYVSLTFT